MELVSTKCCWAFTSFVKTCAETSCVFYWHDSNYMYTCIVNTCDIWNEKNAFFDSVFTTSLRHGLQLLLAWSVSRCMCLPTNQDVATQCTTNVTWPHSQTTCITFKTGSPPVSAVRLFHVRAVALRMYDFLQLITVHWLGLHQLITCKSSENMSINTDLTVHLHVSTSQSSWSEGCLIFPSSGLLRGVRRFETDVSGLHVCPFSRVFLDILTIAYGTGRYSRNVGLKPPHAA